MIIAAFVSFLVGAILVLVAGNYLYNNESVWLRFFVPGVALIAVGFLIARLGGGSSQR